ncbi:MAG: SIR2 family protein [Akkermansiaceae bacterium]|nr:SIR2 family protein [Akkermansiaceae bacterium]MCF7733258.1 SIR2 family protein [Akkermansiaceae bacterium]
MTSELKKMLEAANSLPFLFVGSGFTHRYLGTADWKGLVTHFANQSKPEIDFPFEWYKNEVASVGSTDDQILPAITQLVEKDFARRFLSDESFRGLRTRYEAEIRAGVSPLKIGVADLLRTQEVGFSAPNHPEEISALGHARKNVAGVITTNFDRYLEQLFPEHVIYVGQDQLLFNQSYGVGEIYKIHGCVTEPSSLVLTQSDYVSYMNRNAYLSAKLLTIFLEHPIIFIGYSLTDSNIRLIFNDIANCLSEPQLATLSDRLIFVQRSNAGRSEGSSTVRESFGTQVIEFKRVVLSDFSKLYKAIAGLRSSYPQKILRKLKKDVYDLVLTTSPKERIRVIDINDATDMETVEYVMGVGISKQLAGQGYGGLEVNDLIKDLIYDETSLDAKSVVEIVLPKLGVQISNNLPVFKYLSRANDAVMASKLSDYVAAVRSKGIDFWITNSMRKSQKGKPFPQSIEEIRGKNVSVTAKEAQQMLNDLAFVPSGQLDLEAFRNLLVEIYERFDPIQNKSEQAVTTNFRKAVRIFDWLKYGNKKAPEVPKGTEAD